MKIFYMGREIQPNQHTSFFKRFPASVYKHTKQSFKLIGGLAVIIAIAYTYGTIDTATHIINAETITKDSLPSKINKLKNEIVNKIANDENKTMIPGVYDDNKTKSLPAKDKISYGCMQFKISTIQHYHAVLNLGKISDTEAVLLALDCDKAKELGKRVIFETAGGLWNWSVATKEMGAKIELIKELAK